MFRRAGNIEPKNYRALQPHPWGLQIEQIVRIISRFLKQTVGGGGGKNMSLAPSAVGYRPHQSRT